MHCHCKTLRRFHRGVFILALLLQTAEKLEKDEEGFSSSPSLPFPVVVCVTRSDWSAEVGSQGSPQALEILEAYLRRECLKMGAALVFTSCKDSEK